MSKSTNPSWREPALPLRASFPCGSQRARLGFASPGLPLRAARILLDGVAPMLISLCSRKWVWGEGCIWDWEGFLGSGGVGELVFGGIGDGSGGDASPVILCEPIGEEDAGGEEPLLEDVVDAEFAL